MRGYRTNVSQDRSESRAGMSGGDVGVLEEEDEEGSGKWRKVE
jgi:hypothetical protein